MIRSVTGSVLAVAFASALVTAHKLNTTVCVCNCQNSEADYVPKGNCQPASDPAACDGSICYASEEGGLCLGSEGDLVEIFSASSPEVCSAWIQAAEGKQINAAQQAVMQAEVMSGVLNSVISNETRVWSSLNTSAATEKAHSNASAPVTCPAWSQVLQEGCNGKCVQDCVNGYIFEKGEGALEQAACDYVTAGVGAGFCSEVLPYVLQPVNDFVNAHIEKRVVAVADKIEDAVVNAGRKLVSWLGF
jgi:hypothetical protein